MNLKPVLDPQILHYLHSKYLSQLAPSGSGSGLAAGPCTWSKGQRPARCMAKHPQHISPFPQSGGPASLGPSSWSQNRWGRRAPNDARLGLAWRSRRANCLKKMTWKKVEEPPGWLRRYVLSFASHKSKSIQNHTKVHQFTPNHIKSIQIHHKNQNWSKTGEAKPDLLKPSQNSCGTEAGDRLCSVCLDFNQEGFLDKKTWQNPSKNQ